MMDHHQQDVGLRAGLEKPDPRQGSHRQVEGLGQFAQELKQWAA